MILFFLLVLACDEPVENEPIISDPGYYLKIYFKHSNSVETEALSKSIGNISYRILNQESRKLLDHGNIDTTTIVFTDSAFMAEDKFLFNATFYDFNDVQFFEKEQAKDTIFNKIRTYADWSISLKPIKISHQFKYVSTDTIPGNFDSFNAIFQHQFFNTDTLDSLIFINDLSPVRTINAGSYDLLVKLKFKDGSTVDTLLADQKFIKPEAGNLITELRDLFK